MTAIMWRASRARDRTRVRARQRRYGATRRRRRHPGTALQDRAEAGRVAALNVGAEAIEGGGQGRLEVGEARVAVEGDEVLPQERRPERKAGFRAPFEPEAVLDGERQENATGRE